MGAAATVVSAMVGMPIRLYLLTAVCLDYHRFGDKYRRLWPFIFALDLLGSLSPLLIETKIGSGLALAAIAPLLYSPFAQRILVVAPIAIPNENPA